MNRSAMASIGVCGFAAAACGGVVSQSVSVFVDETTNADGQRVVFDRFDTMDGTRVLQSVNVRYEVSMSLEATFESFTERPLAAGEWSGNVYHNIAMAFFAEDGGPAAPYYGLGGISVENVTGDLTPGVPGPSPFEPGTPGDPLTESYADSLDSLQGTNPFFFDFFVGDGTVSGQIGPLFDTEIFFPIDAFVSGYASAYEQSGTLSLHYVYTEVPAPAGVGVLALGGLAAVRRRRAAAPSGVCSGA